LNRPEALRSLPVSDSPLLAYLPRFITTAHPSCRIELHTGEKKMRPIRQMFHQTVFHRLK
jgi:hypothetical protein